MNRLSNFLSAYVGIELWMASLVIIALVTVLANQLAQLLLRHAAKVARRTSSVWDDALVRSASRPVLTAMWLVGAGVMARVLQRQIDEPFLAEVTSLRDVALIACVT